MTALNDSIPTDLRDPRRGDRRSVSELSACSPASGLSDQPQISLTDQGVGSRGQRS
jgi:hypothetical protein